MATAAVHYGSTREGRQHFKDLLDAADEGRPAVVTRDKRRTAAVDADRFVEFLTRLHPSGARAVPDGDGWSVFLPGLPVAADGANIAEAADEMVDALRDYAEAWTERLRLAPNHEDNWGPVQIVTLASDDQLRDWLLADRGQCPRSGLRPPAQTMGRASGRTSCGTSWRSRLPSSATA